MNPPLPLAPTAAPVPFIPDHAPFSPGATRVAEWVSRRPLLPGRPIRPRRRRRRARGALSPLAILFGSQTGTAETLAKKAAKCSPPAGGFAPTVVDMAQISAARLAGRKTCSSSRAPTATASRPTTPGPFGPPSAAAGGAVARRGALRGLRRSATRTTRISASAERISTRVWRNSAPPASPPGSTATSITRASSPRWLQAALRGIHWHGPGDLGRRRNRPGDGRGRRRRLQPLESVSRPRPGGAVPQRARFRERGEPCGILA